MSRLISRDPFARTELRRAPERLPEGSNRMCSACGFTKVTPKGNKFLYRYSTHADDGRVIVHKGLFCCKPCHDAYHS